MELKITEHFDYKEVTKTKFNLDNEPSTEQLEYIKALCENVLERVREHFNCPIILSSCFRSKAVNKAAGGAKTSHHLCVGGFAAADISCIGSHNLKDVYNYIKNNLEFSELVYEFGTDFSPSWIHVSFNIDSSKNIKECWRSKLRKNSKTYYIKY